MGKEKDMRKVTHLAPVRSSLEREILEGELAARPALFGDGRVEWDSDQWGEKGFLVLLVRGEQASDNLAFLLKVLEWYWIEIYEVPEETEG